MSTNSEIAPSRAAVITGYVIGVLPALMMLFSAALKFAKPTMVVEEFARLGWQENTILLVGVLEVASVALYLIPRTAVLGAILLTGYLGGAIATHARMPENFIGPVIFGVLFWLGLYLRDLRVRALIPTRR